MPKQYNPSDATLRNTRAANKRLDKLEKRVGDLEDVVKLAVIAMKADSNKQLKAQVKNLETAVNSLKQTRWE